MGTDGWARATWQAMEEMVRAFETGTWFTVFEQPGKVARLPDALGGAHLRNLLALMPASLPPRTTLPPHTAAVGQRRARGGQQEATGLDPDHQVD